MAEVFKVEPDIDNKITPEIIDIGYQPLINYAIEKQLLSAETKNIDSLLNLSSDKVQILNSIKEEMKTSGTTYANAETVVLYFENFPSQKYSQAERKQITFDIINGLQKRIANGELSMKQAGDIIINNADLKEVDSAWQSNAYREINYAKKNEPSILDPEIDRELWQIPVNSVSPVLVFHNPDKTESAYMILLVSERQQKEFETYQQFLDHYKN